MNTAWPLILSGLVHGSDFILVALGFGLVYRVAGVFHFAHGAVYVLGAYLAFLFHRSLGWPASAAIPTAILLTTLSGVAIEAAIYRPLRRRNASGGSLFLASVAVFVVVGSVISLIFGDQPLILRRQASESVLDILGAKVTSVRLYAAVLNLAAGSCVAIWLQSTRWGKVMRAVASDPELAKACGMNTFHTYVLAMAISSCACCCAAILVAQHTDLTPGMGFNVLLFCFVAAIMGGIGNPFGAIVGSVCLGLVLNAAVWKIPTQWQDGIAFLTMLVILLVRPQGFLGESARRVSA